MAHTMLYTLENATLPDKPFFRALRCEIARRTAQRCPCHGMVAYALPREMRNVVRKFRRMRYRIRKKHLASAKRPSITHEPSPIVRSALCQFYLFRPTKKLFQVCFNFVVFPKNMCLSVFLHKDGIIKFRV